MSWQWRMMRNLKKNWLVISKLAWRIWWILTRTIENLKNFHFNMPLLSKVYIYCLSQKKYRGVIFHETEEGYKISREIDLSLPDWRKGFDKFWREHSRGVILQKLKRNWLVVWKMTWEIWQIFTRNKWIANLTKIFTHV